MNDYFRDLIEKLERNESINIYKKDIRVDKNDIEDFTLLGPGIMEDVKYIYQNYSKFILYWESDILDINGSVLWVAFCDLKEKHDFLIQMSEECYDPDIEDIDNICNDIKNWYPLFEFPNGDAFCLDKRNNKIVFYEHEVYDTGINLHGLIIAEDINQLYQKWFKCLCVDVYDWFDVVNENGLDLSCELLRKIQML